MGLPVVARWEWRTFGARFGAAEARIRTYPAETQSSRETYIVCDASNTNAKIRNGLLDVKVLEEVNAAGLERWRPIMKAAFPIDPSTIGALFRAWNLPDPQLVRPSYALGPFLSKVVEPHARLTVIDVAKDRSRFTIDGCLVEIADLIVDNSRLRTVAVEADDAALVARTVQSLELSAYENVNYVKALKRWLSSNPHHRALGGR